MRYEIVLAPEARDDLLAISARERARLKDEMEVHLRREPTRTSKSRIKRLRGLAKPQYRLRVDKWRVFYDVRGRRVEVLAVIAKPNAAAWLSKKGEPG